MTDPHIALILVHAHLPTSDCNEDCTLELPEVVDELLAWKNYKQDD